MVLHTYITCGRARQGRGRGQAAMRAYVARARCTVLKRADLPSTDAYSSTDA